MPSYFLQNAILAKSGAMYGRRLTGENYASLLACRAIDEAAAYLKTQTIYGDVLKNLSTSGLHRGQLEEALQKNLFALYESLFRFGTSTGQNFQYYYIMRSDIKQILTCLHLLTGGESGEYIYRIPAFFNNYTEIPLFELAKAGSFPEILKTLTGTVYEEVFSKFNGQAMTNRLILEIEADLYRYFYARLDEIIRKDFRGKRLKSLQRLLSVQADIHMAEKLYRLKRNGCTDESLLRRFVYPDFTLLSAKQINAVVTASDSDELLKLLGQISIYKGLSENPNSLPIELLTKEIMFKVCKKSFRFSGEPMVAMLSCLFLAEIELGNLIHIIEGIRYGLPPEKVQFTLIGFSPQTTS